MHPSNQRVQAVLRRAGLDTEVRDLAESTRTAAEAAAALDAEVAQIVKSLLFFAGTKPVLLLVSGAHRVDLELAGRALGSPVRQANAEEVRAVTGFPIGGVAPVGLARQIPVFYDPVLLTFDRVWAAAGTPRSIFPIAPRDLLKVTGALPLAAMS